VLTLLKQIHSLFTRQQWRSYLLLQTLFAATALIQVAGVASLAPFIALLADQELIHKNKISSYIFEKAEFNSDPKFLMSFAVAIMLFIVASNGIAAITTWSTVKFSQNLGLELQRALYRNYLYKDYVYFSKTNSSKMIAMITEEAPRFTYMVVQPLLNLVSQAFIVLIIGAGLLYVNASLAAIAIVIISCSYLGVFRAIKHSLLLHGSKLFEANNRKFRLLNESLGGIKEVKLLATETLYEQKVSEANASNAHSNAIIGIMADLPRFAIETISFCALLGLALFMLATKGDSAQIISILSLYAMAGYKLLPAAQTMFKSASQIKANHTVLHELYPAVMEGRAVCEPEVTTTPLPIDNISGIELSNLSYQYPGSNTAALEHINITIKRNSLVAFVGSSGAGKSTLADVLLGFLSPTDGEIRIGTTPITKTNIRAWQRHLGYVPQNIFLLDDTIAANIMFGAVGQSLDADKLQAAAQMANIDQVVENLSGKYSFVVGERGARLSGGQKQRIGIARALYHDADFLVLDEATSALDNITEQEIIKTIQQLKSTKTIIMIAHRLSSIRNADQIVFLENGKINDIGTFDYLNTNNEKFKKMTQTGL